jgi:ClpP class serine protease
MEGLFKGRMFDTAESKAGGLIDAVGTLSTAINKVAELARVQQRSAGNTISLDGGILVLNKNVDKQ